MQRRLHSILTAAIVCLTTLTLTTGVSAADAKANPTGTWTWTSPGRGGGAEVKSTLKLKAEGDKLTGELSAPGRGGEVAKIEIGDGKLKGDEISFTVTREFNGNKIVTKYAGKISGDSIKGESERPGRDGGEARKTPWDAKREAAK
jgi:hypothetical protein